MESIHNDSWERSLEAIAQHFDYPLTPDIAAAIRPRLAGGRQQKRATPRPLVVGYRLAWAALLLVLLAAGLMAVPQTRAAVLSFFARIGAIEIFIDETAPTVVPTVEEESSASPAPAVAGSTPNLPSDNAAHSLELFELGEPATLDEASRAVGFSPAIPEALGRPDEVYIHDDRQNPPSVTLVWRSDDGSPLSLTQIDAPGFGVKMVSTQGVKSLRVGGVPAVWLKGPHKLQLLDSWQESDLLIASNVLIWELDGLTYRLEGDLTEAEMVSIAESIRAE
jgi:hypothetical protein